MLEACIQVRLEAKVDDDRIVVTVDMGVDAVHAFEDLKNERLERFGERYTCRLSVAQSYYMNLCSGKIVLHLPILLGNICSLSILPCTHAIRCSMYSGAGIFVGFLKFSLSCHKYSNSSVAFISGQVWGLQNSVIEP